MLQSRLTMRRGREFIEITSARAAASVEEETRQAIEEAERELARWGLPPETIVRSRLWARDRETRDRASLARKDALANLKRGASASFIAPGRLASNSRVALDIVALRPRPGREEKIVREYDPPITPPAFVILDGLVALSGLTDTSNDLQAQVASIRRRIDDNLSLARADWTKVISVSVFVHRSVGPSAALDAVRLNLPPRWPQAVSVAEVDGFSHPAKLIEIEVTADLGET